MGTVILKLFDEVKYSQQLYRIRVLYSELDFTKNEALDRIGLIRLISNQDSFRHMLARALQQCSAKHYHYHHYGSKIITGSFSRRIRLASAAAFLAIAVISSPSSLTICDAAPLNRFPAAVTARNTILLEKLRPASNQYTRIDEGPLMKKENQAWVNDHAIHGTLNKESGIELYEIYKCNNSDDILCIIKFGSSLNGYPGVVHGGITALMFDNSFGWLLQASNAPPAVTANLEVNYR